LRFIRESCSPALKTRSLARGELTLSLCKRILLHAAEVCIQYSNKPSTKLEIHMLRKTLLAFAVASALVACGKSDKAPEAGNAAGCI
jgi:hypothetical protein